ncbi:hypothetical protein [Sphingomonas qomolangmaensis]|uniref:Uncharacterized protein n=1 Tax=Sphingomonas qomolangmaensis TaxID=2918765 RepID=A0ABY5LCC3_9SPHN|nr:hypothetical protein [Sphingomonas qomolangmaensis]UUL83384.1 hypothetical protein NMP03_03895 [Sphingomonas qomolangmaensis]
MLELLANLLQAANPASAPLMRIDILDRCAAPAGDEIIVCGDRNANERFRLRPLRGDTAGSSALPKAEILLFGDTRAAAEVEAEQIGPGLTSQRMMLRLKTPF